MDEMEVYLSLHPEIKDVKILTGCCSQDRIDEFLENTNLENVDFIDMKCNVNPDKLLDDCALCCIDAYSVDVNELLVYRPKYIIGTIIEGIVPIFELWEKAREYCNSFYVKNKRISSDGRVYEWNRGEYNIELSIVLPMYKVESYLDRCIKSVTAWKADYVEYIFVDDGSPDESSDIVKKWQLRDKRIRLIRKENGGCASARQRGLEEAKGRYVGFVDPDDFVDERMFKRLFAEAMCGNYDISFCGYYEYYEDTKKVKPAYEPIPNYYYWGTYDRQQIWELITLARVAIWRGIYRRSFLEKNNIHFYTDLKRFDDLPFKVETFANAYSVVRIPDDLYYYRLNREGQDVLANDDKLYVHFDIFNHLNESILATKNQRIIDNLQMCKIQTHRYALSKIKDEYRAEYRRRARADLLVLGDFKRTYKITAIKLGDEVAEEYRSIMK